MRASTRRRRIDGEAWDEVVHAARDVVDRHARRIAPTHTVARRREDDVVRRAALAETAVLPRDVDGPVTGDFRGR